MDQDDNVICFNVRDIEPYNDEKDKATEHVASVIGRTLEETGRLIRDGKVFLFINKETEETWFDVFE